MSETEKRFDPREHLQNLKGKQYLPVFARIAAYRDVCPIQEGWGIRTEQTAGSLKEQFATFRAEIIDPSGRIVATGTKTEDVKGFPDFAEKAETGSIGRALAAAGFGTLFALEFEEGSERITDAPIAPKSGSAKASSRTGVSKQAEAGEGCTICGKKDVPPGRVAYCVQQNAPVTHFDCAKAQEG